MRNMGESLTAPCAGYCRASAMWSLLSFAGRASSALRNDLQNASSDMVKYLKPFFVRRASGFVVVALVKACIAPMR